MSRCLGDLLGHAECGMSGTSVLRTLGKQPSVASLYYIAFERKAKALRVSAVPIGMLDLNMIHAISAFLLCSQVMRTRN
jgi:hypothetical protein